MGKEFLFEIIAGTSKYASMIMFVGIIYIFVKQLYKNYNDKSLSAIDYNYEGSVKTFFGIFFVAIISRFVLYYIMYLVAIDPVDPTGFFETIGNSVALQADAGWYHEIVENFYVTKEYYKYAIVFMPLYPLTVRAVNVLFNNSIFSMFFVSDVCLGIACYFLYELAKPHIGKRGAKHAVILMLLYPVSFFLGLGFSESMFIMLCAIFFYLLDRDKYLAATCVGYFGALTRNVGILLVVPYIIKLFFDLRPLENKQYKQFIKNALYCLITIMGTMTYLIINKIIYGHAFQFMAFAKENWQQSLGCFWNSISSITYLALSPSSTDFITLYLPQLVMIFFTLAVLLYGGKYLEPHYFAFSICYFLVTIGAANLMSAPRYLMALIPVYLIIGKIASEDKKTAFLIYLFFISALIIMTTAYALEYKIF